MTDGKYAGDAIASLIKDEVTEERSRKSSIEQRALAVITSSGVLVTLLFGLVALWTKDPGFHPPVNTDSDLRLAASLFLVAALLGLVCNLPLFYLEVAVDEMEKLVTPEWWEHDRSEAERQVASTQLRNLSRARTTNNWKVFALFTAMILELVAVLLVATVSFTILNQPPEPTSSPTTEPSKIEGPPAPKTSVTTPVQPSPTP